jgi:hypothetical protein
MRCVDNPFTKQLILLAYRLPDLYITSSGLGSTEKESS